MPSIDEAIETIYRLNVGVVGNGSDRHERPHKPILLLTVLDLLATKHAQADRIPWDKDLKARFAKYFEIVRAANDNNTPENPFFYLKSDGFWQPVELAGGTERPLLNTPTATQAQAGAVCGRLTDGWDQLVRFPEQRSKLREAIVSRYFPDKRLQLVSLFSESGIAATQNGSSVNEDEPEPGTTGRDSAFRKLVLAAYDCQCAACGLRIKLPDSDFTFVDGAHLIPFSVNGNDNPRNGIALCKNHHWAMDRFLLVPTPEKVWRVSPRLIAHRSTGEKELLQLNEAPVLPPHDDAYAPDPDALVWRASRLLA